MKFYLLYRPNMKRLVETCDDKGEMWLLLSNNQDKQKLERTAATHICGHIYQYLSKPIKQIYGY